MSSKKRTRAQAKKDRRALSKLKSTGLFRGEIDARKAPSPAAKRALKRFADVIAGRAKVLEPAKPRSYKGTFRVVGDKVIVPRQKGRRVRVDKSGRIVLTRKIGGRRRKGRFVKMSELAPSGKMYVLGLQHGNGMEWYKFDSRADLEKFVYETSPKVGATFKKFADYVLEIDADEFDKAVEDEGVDEDEFFENKLYKHLSRRRRKRRAAKRRARRR